MAQDPVRELDESSDFDLVTLFSSSNHDGEMEATSIHAMLQANGLPSVVVGPSVLPSLDFQVQVPQAYIEEAKRVLQEARDAGPQAAAEAEAASEGR
jgi:hypothetical protein